MAMDLHPGTINGLVKGALLILGAVVASLPSGSCDRDYRFIGSPLDDTITLAPLSNGWRPVLSTASWRQQHSSPAKPRGGATTTTVAAALHPVHGKVHQHLRADKARKRLKAAESNHVEVFAPAPPSVLGSFSLVGKGRDKKKVTEQEELLPQGRIVYSARLVPPPVQSSLSDSFSSSEDQRLYLLQSQQKANEFTPLSPPAKSAKTYYNRPSTLELFPSAGSDTFSNHQQSSFYLSKYVEPQSAVHNTGIYLDPGQRVPSPSLSNQQTFKALPDSLQFFKEFFDKHKDSYSGAISSQHQSFLEKQKSEPVIESVELGKEVFYGKDVNTNPYTHFNNYNGKFTPQFKNPSEVEIVHEKHPDTGLYSTPAPDFFNYNKPLPDKGTSNYKYQVGTQTTSPFSNPSHVFIAPTPLPLIQPTFPTAISSSTFRPQIKNEFKLSPVQFVTPTSVTLQPQGENGRIPRPNVHDKRTNENVPEIHPITNGHAPFQHAPHTISSIHNEKDAFVTFLPTISPETQTTIPEQGLEEGITSTHSTLNEVTPIPGRGRVTFKQSPTNPLPSQTSLSSIKPFGIIQKHNIPSPTGPYKELEQPVFGTQQPDTVTYMNEVSTVYPVQEQSLPEISRPHVKIPDRSRQRSKPSRRPTTTLGSLEQKEFQRQRNPQRTRQSNENTRHVQNHQHKYMSSTPIDEENTFENNENIITPHNKQQVQTATVGTDIVTDDNVKYTNTKPNVSRRPPARYNENDYNDESKTEDNIHSSTQSYYTRRPDAQKLVRENYESEETDFRDPSQEKEKVYTSRRPNLHTKHVTRSQHLIKNNEQSPTRSPHPSRRRPQTQRDNMDTKDGDGYKWDQDYGYQGTRTHHPRRPSSNRGQVSYNTNGYTNKEYDGIKRRPNYRQRPPKYEMTDTTEFEEESDKQTETNEPYKHRIEQHYNQYEVDSSNSNVNTRRRKPTNANYNHNYPELTPLNHQTNNEYLPGSSTLTNEVTSQIYSTTARPNRRHPSLRPNKDRYNIPSSTQAVENSVPVTRVPSHYSNSPSMYNQGESYAHSYQTNYGNGPDNTFPQKYENKDFENTKNTAFVKDNVPNHEDSNDELRFEFNTTLEPVRTSTSSTSTTTTDAPTTIAATTTSTTTTATTTTSSTTSTTTATTSVIPPTTTAETEPPPPETSTMVITSTSTETHSPLYTPFKLRPRLRSGTNSSRPRFSVKDYRQRLNKQNENEEQDENSDKNDSEKQSASYHARYPSRTRGSETYRSEPSGSKSTTTEASKTRYRYGERPRTTSTRYRTTSATTRRPDISSSTEKAGGFRPSTSRFKPGSGKFYSRYRSNTPPPAQKLDEESTNNVSSTTPRIVMNPRGVFSAMRRIYPLKVLTSGHKNASAEEEPAKLGASDVVHTLPPTFVITPQTTTEVTSPSSTERTNSTERVSMFTAISVDDYTPSGYKISSNRSAFHTFVGLNSHSGMENVFSPTLRHEDKAQVVKSTNDESSISSTPSSEEPQSPSQIVAGLTSAGTASGYFKSANSLSPRPTLRITMATEDPILPIEAFFPVLSNKD